jgi:PTS system nitrogen regulatory IIA component
MQLRDLVQADLVHLDVDGRDPVEALEFAADRFEERQGLSADVVVRSLLEREQLGSTSVGHGFAIPHCKIEGLKALDLLVVRFSEPVDFGAPDDEPVRFFFVVVSPPDQPAHHLKLLSQIARILKRSELRERLLTAPEPGDIVEAIHQASRAEGL